MENKNEFEIFNDKGEKITCNALFTFESDETGKNYSTSKFGMEMLRFFRSLNLPISRSNKGNTLYITIK